MTDAFMQQIGEMYRAVEAGDRDGIATHIAHDAFGMSGEWNGIFTGRGPFASDLSRWRGLAAPGTGLRLQSTDLHVSLSESGRSGWFWDQVRVGRAGGKKEIVVRVTALVCVENSTWQIKAAHWSVPISNERTKALIRDGRLEEGAVLNPAIEPGADALERLLDSALADQPTYPDLYSTRDEQTTTGSAVEEVFRGPAAKAAWQEFLGYEPTFARRGGVRGGIAPDGTLGWLATHLDISFGVPTPYRFFYIWRRDGDDWEIVASHDSVSVDPCEELASQTPD